MLSKTSSSRKIRAIEIRTNPATGKRFTKAEFIAILAKNASALYARQLTRYTLADLQQKVDQRIKYDTTRYAVQKVATGSIHSFDFQADIFEGQFEIVGYDTATGDYTAAYLAPNDRVIEAIIASAENGSYYAAPGEDRWERAEREIQERTAQAGKTFKIRFVSAAAYAEYF
jgi:hypothetical protein